MATTVKGGTFGKEKRGTSPSSSLIKKSPKPSSSTPAPSSSTNDTTSSATSAKPVPNYLKPTMSSNRDFSRLPRKSSSLDSSTDKPVLNRRKSLDRPSLVSQAPKGNHIVPGALGIKPLRSSSFSHKPTTSSSSGTSIRPAIERPYARASSSLSPRDHKAEPALSKLRTLKKSSLSSSTPSTKKGTKATKSVTLESSHVDHPSTDQLPIDEDFKGIQCEVQSLPEISEMPDSNEELGDPTITYIDQQHVGINKEIEDDEGSKPINLDHGAKQGLSLESTTPYPKLKILKHNQDKGKSINYDDVRKQGPSLETIKPDQQPETVKGNKDESSKPMNVDQVEKQGVSLESATPNHKPETVKDDEDEGKPMSSDQVVERGLSLENVTADHKPETVKENVVARSEKADSNPTTELIEETYTGDNEAQIIENPIITPEEKKEELAVEKQEKAKDENSSTSSPAKKAQNTTNAGKKEKQEYNDVIEKKTSELMGMGMGGKRKNKVLALAGAFETVISLENTKK